ncbi:UPF0488 protein C8orf33 homolog [Parasteatoda tepidariorum]|uniref:UPF0488 protein C8orf33 homolog n=1 Tax=Parasteatoda tepidariorum TaxID=114398 RepID=UPI00077FC2B4|nr:UPF0488 protein C8orf33 homolog isoform X2 [Parasteatoda tepidariorum]
MDSEEEEFSLEEQVFWCIKNIEQKLQVKNMNPKQAKSLLQSLKVLANEKTPLIKKRQVMRMTCGDYRTSMQDEMKQLKQQMKKHKIAPVEKIQGSRFLHKSIKNCNEEKEEMKKTENNSSIFLFNFPNTDEING